MPLGFPMNLREAPPDLKCYMAVLVSSTSPVPFRKQFHHRQPPFILLTYLPAKRSSTDVREPGLR